MVHQSASLWIASIKFVGDRVLFIKDDVAVIAAIYISYDGGMEPNMMGVKSSSGIDPLLQTILFFFSSLTHSYLMLSSYLSDMSLPARIHESSNTCLTCNSRMFTLLFTTI
jgi:hypothetical protein